MRRDVRFLESVCLCALVLSSASCKDKAAVVTANGSAEKAASVVGKMPEPVPEPEPEPVPVNPEYEKLDQVLSGMSPRFAEVVQIADDDRDAFLEELHSVLDEEETFRKDDLSLYYLIDKKHSVSSDYVPKDLVHLVNNADYNISRNDLSLRPDVEEALRRMAKAALEDGIKLMVSSTYRSYDYQVRLFNRYVAQDGVELAERYSARAGTSQHQLGVAIDFGSITDDFAETRMGRWLANNSEDYGWSLSFPQGYEDVTGFMWECWHFRYVGVPACRFQKKWFGDVQQFMIEFIDAWKNTI